MTQRLPIPGKDDGIWGDVLNGFLSVAHNPDGTLIPAALTQAGAGTYSKPSSGIPASDLAPNLPVTILDNPTQTAIASVASKYVKPASGIPANDLTSAVQANLTSASTAVQSVNSKTGTSISLTASDVAALPTTTKLAGLADTSAASAATNNQVLAYNSGTSQWVPSTVSSTTVGDATTTSKGIVQLAGDLSGTAASPTVAKVNGITLPVSAPSAGNVLTAASATTTTWTTPAAGVTLDTTAGDIQADTTTGSALAGSTGKAADAGHQHPLVAHDHTTTNKGGQIPVAGLSATGTASSTTFLRGDGSWTTPAAGFSDPTTTKGDLIIHGTSTTRQPIGSDGQVLTADSTQATGAKWATPSTTDTTKLAIASNLSDLNNAGTARTNLGLGGAATLNVGTTSGTVAAGNQAASGDLTGTLPSPTVAKVQGIAISSTAPTANQVLTASSPTAAAWATPATASNATTSTPGLVQLAGDLGGINTSATTPSLAATSNVTSIVNTIVGSNTTVTGALQKSSNLSDLASTSTARSNLGLAAVASSGSYTDLSNVPSLQPSFVETTANASGSPYNPSNNTAAWFHTDTTGGTVNIHQPSSPVAGYPIRISNETGTNNAVFTPLSLDITPGNSATVSYDSVNSRWVAVDQYGGVQSGSTVGGDLSGTLPNPTVAKVNGITLPGSAPTANQVLTATSGTTTTWSTPAAGVTLDTAAADIAPLGIQAAGATGMAADAGHVHAMPRLDQVNAPTAAVGLNSQKLTGLANGAATTDAAAFGQIPIAGVTAGTYAAGDDSRITGAATGLSTTVVQTTTYSASANQLVPCDATSGAFTVTLPTAPADKTRMIVKKIDNSANAVTIAAGGSDVFNKAGGSTTGSLSLQNQAIVLQYASGPSIWYVTADDISLTQMDGRYTQKVNNLSDLASTSTARTNLGLGGAAILNVGTITGTVAAGDDARFNHRTITSVSTATAAGAAAYTDYVYLVSGTTTVTLPTAVGNTNRYTITNVGSNTVTVATTSSQTINGSASATLPIPNMSLDFISNNANWIVE